MQLIICLLLLMSVALPAWAQRSQYKPPSLTEQLSDLGFDNAVEVEDETFPPGAYTLSLHADLMIGTGPIIISQRFLTTGGTAVILRVDEPTIGVVPAPVAQPFFAQVPFSL